jgi:hypothetical protein
LAGSRGDGGFQRRRRPDLAVANRETNNISVLLGTGNGAFAPSQDYTVGQVPFAIAGADFNGDGKLDLLVVANLDNAVGVMLGNGDGTFQQPFYHVVGDAPGPSL